MKHIVAGVCLTLSLAGIAVPMNAQDVSLGVKAGPNFTTFAGSDVSGAKSLARIIGGGFMVVEVSRNLALQPELLLAQKGAKVTDASESAKLKINYFEVPLLLRVQPNPGTARFMPHALVGPTIAYKSSCKISGTSNNVTVSVNCDEGQFQLPVKNVDYGLAFGAGLDMGLGRMFAVLDVRYELGLSKIDDDSNPNDVKNRALAIMVGVRFPLGPYATRQASASRP